MTSALTRAVLPADKYAEMRTISLWSLERWLVTGLAVSVVLVAACASAFGPGVSPNADVLAFPLQLIALAVFLVPGLAVTGMLLDRRVLKPLLGAFTCCLVGTIIGLLSFWAYYASAALGTTSSLLLVFATASCLAMPEARRWVLRAWSETDVRVPVLSHRIHLPRSRLRNLFPVETSAGRPGG
jgi:hypothetical protein